MKLEAGNIAADLASLRCRRGLWCERRASILSATECTRVDPGDVMIAREQILKLLTDQILDPGTQLSIGAFGGIAE
jgi:hypothetical protein